MLTILIAKQKEKEAKKQATVTPVINKEEKKEMVAPVVNKEAVAPVVEKEAVAPVVETKEVVAPVVEKEEPKKTLPKPMLEGEKDGDFFIVGGAYVTPLSWLNKPEQAELRIFIGRALEGSFGSRLDVFLRSLVAGHPLNDIILQWSKDGYHNETLKIALAFYRSYIQARNEMNTSDYNKWKTIAVFPHNEREKMRLVSDIMTLSMCDALLLQTYVAYLKRIGNFTLVDQVQAFVAGFAEMPAAKYEMLLKMTPVGAETALQRIPELDATVKKLQEEKKVLEETVKKLEEENKRVADLEAQLETIQREKEALENACNKAREEGGEQRIVELEKKVKKMESEKENRVMLHKISQELLAESYFKKGLPILQIRNDICKAFCTNAGWERTINILCGGNLLDFNVKTNSWGSFKYITPIKVAMYLKAIVLAAFDLPDTFRNEFPLEISIDEFNLLEDMFRSIFSKDAELPEILKDQFKDIFQQEGVYLDAILTHFKSLVIAWFVEHVIEPAGPVVDERNMLSFYPAVRARLNKESVGK